MHTAQLSLPSCRPDVGLKQLVWHWLVWLVVRSIFSHVVLLTHALCDVRPAAGCMGTQLQA